MQLKLGMLKKKLICGRQRVPFAQATAASRILKERGPDVTLLSPRRGLRTMAEVAVRTRTLDNSFAAYDA
jgi:hypothetical protein